MPAIKLHNIFSMFPKILVLNLEACVKVCIYELRNHFRCSFRHQLEWKTLTTLDDLDCLKSLTLPNDVTDDQLTVRIGSKFPSDCDT